MADYLNRQRQTYDAEGVLITAGAITASVAVKVGVNQEVNVGENVLLEAVLQVRGTVSGTSPTLDVSVQESDTEGGTYTAIPGASFVQKTAVGEERIAFRTTKAWVCTVITAGGTTPSFGDTEAFIAG